MNARERAKQAIESSTIPPNHSQWWAILISPAQIEMLTHSIEQAIIEAEEAKAKEERDACAMIADRHEIEAMAQLEESKRNGKGLSEIGHVFEASAAKWISDAIRARSGS